MWSALIVFVMASATSYRRRSDGVLEITRPNAWQRLGIPTRSCLAAAGLLAAGVAGMFVHVQLGIPLLMLAACCALALVMRHTGQERRRPAPPPRVQRATLQSVR